MDLQKSISTVFRRSLTASLLLVKLGVVAAEVLVVEIVLHLAERVLSSIFRKIV